MAKLNWAKDKQRQQMLRAASEARERDRLFDRELIFDDRPKPAPWREITADDKTPLLGDQYTATINGRMWERNIT